MAIVMVVVGEDVTDDTLKTGTGEKHLPRHGRSIISALVDGLKIIHSTIHNKKPEEVSPAEPSDEVSVTAYSTDFPSYGNGEVVASRSSCRIEYVVVSYVVNSEVMTRECRSRNQTSCHTTPYEKCVDQLREECHQSVREDCKDMLEEECNTQHRTEHSQETVRECNRKCQYQWEGTNEDKRWVVDPAICTCGDITRKTVARVPYLNCRLVSRKVCENVPIRECKEVKERICEQKEREECKAVPHRECKDIHRKVPNTITRNMPRQVCGEENNGEAVVVEAA